ncbi:hypothetical protein T484DRAFT_1965425 [Baffinella frigidus]|nr:hypothetical protein T484DRAFT_1965425 [Cryptophyta sp. CCMP2293]
MPRLRRTIALGLLCGAVRVGAPVPISKERPPAIEASAKAIEASVRQASSLRQPLQAEVLAEDQLDHRAHAAGSEQKPSGASPAEGAESAKPQQASVESGSLGAAGGVGHEERGVAGPHIVENREIVGARHIDNQEGGAGAAKVLPVDSRVLEARGEILRVDGTRGMLSMHFGCLVAFMAAISANLGKVCQKRGTQDLPLLQFKGNVLRTYLGSPWWVAGLGLDVSGALMTLVALALAPVSVVQPILGCGLAFVAIFSHYLTSDHLRTFDWAACFVCVAGTIGIGASSEEGSGHEEMFLLVGVLLLCFFALVVAASEVMARSRMLHLEVASSISAGVCFGLSACSTRCGLRIASDLALSGGAAAGLASLVAGILGVAGSVVLSSSGFFCQTRGLKDGRAIVVVAYSNLVALLVAVVFGIFALSEPLPHSTAGLVGRAASLLCLVAGSFALSTQGSSNLGALPTKASHATPRKVAGSGGSTHEMRALEGHIGVVSHHARQESSGHLAAVTEGVRESAELNPKQI